MIEEEHFEVVRQCVTDHNAALKDLGNFGLDFGEFGRVNKI